jgi:lysophospholipase L1-like esterase
MQDTRRRTRLRRLVRGFVGALAALVITLVAAEAILQLAALFAGGREEGWAPEARHRILCVGDSHTYGAMVKPAEAYPARLQRLLDEQAPGEFSVLNLGVPGMNTAQVRSRLPVQVSRYRPDLVIVWAGINDLWNRAEGDALDTPWRSLDALASRSRLHRFARVLVHDLALDRDVAAHTRAGRHDVQTDGVGADTLFTIRAGGRVERLRHEKGEKRTEEELQTSVERNYEALALWAKDAGVRLAFITYPVSFSGFAAVNRGILAVAGRHGIPVLESKRAWSRIPEEERTLLWGAHPPALVYYEIARDLLPLVTRELVDPTAEAPNPG